MPRRGSTNAFACVVAALLSVPVGVPRVCAQPSEQAPSTSVTDDAIGALHREGDAAFANEDFPAAQRAWTDAYRRIPEGERWNYQATLLALITNVALADFSVRAAQQPVADAAALIDTALSSPQIPDALRPTLEFERERLGAVLDPVRAEPEPESEVEPPPPMLPPTGSLRLDPGLVRPVGPHPSTLWFIAGGVATVGGIAALAVGLSFSPRARRQVSDAGFSASDGAGLAFVDDERRKGLSWVGVGSALAVAGVTSLVIGAVSRSR